MDLRVGLPPPACVKAMRLPMDGGLSAANVVVSDLPARSMDLMRESITSDGNLRRSVKGKMRFHERKKF